MDPELIQVILRKKLFPGNKDSAQLVETHISWVILTPDFAFKMKKPVKFDFLDFSTPEKRLLYCQEELRLNRRLAPDVYLDILPVGKNGIGSEPALDHALRMRRLNNELQLDTLLTQNKVNPVLLDKLAVMLAGFHQRETMHGAIPYKTESAWTDFSELGQHTVLLDKHLGKNSVLQWDSWKKSLEKIVRSWDARLLDRAREGFWVEGHGDLHSRNIFLTDPPVAFDCIEFNRHFREMDVLNELAFLCMDLEFHQQPDLSARFLKAYRACHEIMPEPADARIFIFFKAYRANVRLKVSLLQAEQSDTQQLDDSIHRYWTLMASYLQTLVPDMP